MTRHLLDEVEDAFGHFDVFAPWNCAVDTLRLEFTAPRLESRREAIHTVLCRCDTLGEISIGLVLWPPLHRKLRTPEETLSRLAASGVGASDRWLLRSATSSEDPLKKYLFYSQPIRSLTQVAEPLSQLVALGDFGSWERIAASLYVWADSRVLLRLYDDRGVHVMCRDAATLAACRELFSEFEMPV